MGEMTFDFKSALSQLSKQTAWTRTEQELEALFRARAALLAKRPDRETVNRGSEHLRFAAQDAQFAVALKHVRTIMNPQWVTTLPGVPRELCQITQFGGRILSLVDLAALLGRVGTKLDHPKVVVLECNGSLLGVSAHAVAGIARIDEQQLSPGASSASGKHFIAGISADMTLVLDAVRLVTELRFDGGTSRKHTKDDV